MSILKLENVRQKNAKLSLKLSAKSGYRSTSEYPAISAIQWSAIVAICEETENGRAVLSQFEHLLLLDEAIDAAPVQS